MNAVHLYSISDFMVKLYPETGNIILQKELNIPSIQVYGF
jgi:hypothetical protein